MGLDPHWAFHCIYEVHSSTWRWCSSISGGGPYDSWGASKLAWKSLTNTRISMFDTFDANAEEEWGRSMNSGYPLRRRKIDKSAWQGADTRLVCFRSGYWKRWLKKTLKRRSWSRRRSRLVGTIYLESNIRYCQVGREWYRMEWNKWVWNNA